jgi:hypothetical protein
MFRLARIMLIMIGMDANQNNKETKMEKGYKMIRSLEQEKRCTYRYNGKPLRRLYCDCGCQKPQDSDPDLPIVVSAVKVLGRAQHGYADYTLARDGIRCGEINTQYSALVVDGVEYLGCDRALISGLLLDTAPAHDILPGETIAESTTIDQIFDRIEISEQDDRNAHHAGYCTKCHTFCYGDCESN